MALPRILWGNVCGHRVTVNVKEFNSQRVTADGALKWHALEGKTILLQIIATSSEIDTDRSDSTVVVFPLVSDTQPSSTSTAAVRCKIH
jgi:hypothetical protein